MRANGVKCGALAVVAALVASAAATPKQDLKTEIRVDRTSIPYSVKYEFSRTVGPGRLLKVRCGADGERRSTYEVTFENGKPLRKKLVDTETDEPVDALIYMGRDGYQPSRHAFTRGRVLQMNATAYDPSPATIGRRATGRTATGMKAEYGVVAVDPRIIPLGSLLFIEGYGFAIASDTGGAIKGNRIDLCYDRRRRALSFGRRTVTVHVLRGR